MIQIKRNGKPFFNIEDFGEGSKLSYQLMDHHYIILKFTTDDPVYFEIGDSVEIPDFGYFELTSAYFPKQNDSDGYEYELQMDAYYMSWKNKICKYRPQYGANEASFKLTSTVDVHMNIILSNLKALGLKYNGKDFTVDYSTYNNKAFDAQKRFYIEYNSISILDALNSICSEDALNCEWWIDGSIIYLGYCEMRGQTTFEQDVNVLSMSYSESKSTYITRLYAFGSDRNIPKGYFTGADADVTTDGIATDYLMLPDKEVDNDGFHAAKGYIENVNIVKNEKQAIEGVVMFDDEYPKVECSVSNIKTYDSTVDNEDGTKTTQTFWQVTSADSFTTSFEESWIKSNLTLGIKFTSGALMGMEFDVRFKIIDKVNYFEIVANDTYGRTLPDGVMCPKVGDKFFLFNWDSTKITDTGLIPAAQLSLYERAKQYYQKSMISNANFTCTMDGDKFYNNGTYDYHPLGEQVKLINDMFAQVDTDGKHYRNSRIIGMEIALDIPYDHPQYIVGEKAATSRLGKLEDKVDSITVNGIQINGGNGGGGVYVIGMNDSTPPTDSNVLSARKSINQFLSKLTDDTAQGLITFAKGLVAKALADLAMGAKFGNNAMITKLGDAVFNTIKSLDYDNAAEQGFSIEKEKNGKYHAFITNLTIWGKAIFHELEVRKLSYSGGNIYLSGAGSKLIEVVPVKQSVSADGVTTWVKTTEDDAECVGWKCYLLADNGTTATMNYWQEGDQVRCQTMGEIASGGTYADASNKSYWRTIPKDGVSTQNEKIYGTKTETYLDEAGKEKTREVQVELYGGQSFAWIVVGKHSKGFDGCTEGDSKTAEIQGHPAEGDTIVLDGNRHRNGKQEYDKTDRQNVIILETIGEYAPRIACYANITEYKHTITKSVNNENKEVSLSVFETSPKGGTKINSSRFEWISSDGSTINIINYRGDWVKGNTYHKNDQVNYNNAVWVCVANSEESVIAEPSDSSTQWKKVLSGGKGEKGDDAVSYSVQFSEGADTISGVTTKVLNVTFVKSIGLQIRSGGIRDIDFNGTCVVYVDGVRNDGMTNNLMFGYTYLDIYNAFANEIKGKKSLSVELRDSDNRVVASNIFFFAEKGEKGDQGDKGEQGVKGDKGEDGVDGTDGKDAISILIEDAPLVFDTDDNGIVPVSISKVAKVKVMKGNLNISNECSNINSRDDLCVNCKCGATQKTGYIEVSVSGSNIAKNDVVIDGVNQGKVSATSGYAVIQLTYNGVTYFPQVPFSANVAKFTGVVAFDNKSYKQQFDEVTNRLDKAATKDELTHAKSEFEQTARKISLSVSEKSIARRNLLVGSAFLREDNHYMLSSDARIEMNTGYQGTNCIKCIDDADGTSHYIGVYWEGSQSGRSIKIEKGKKYTISCYYKTNDINANFALEAIYTDKETNANRLGRPKYLSPNNFAPKKVNEWQLCTTVIDTTDAESDYIAFNFWEYCNNKVGRIEAYICRPMVEEGDTYYGWTLSQDDYDIIGANLIDNSRTLDAGGNVIEAKGQKTLVGDAYELTASGSDDYNTFYRIKGSAFKLNTDYTISFEVRGDAKYMGAYVFYPVTNTKFTCYKEPQNGMMIEATGDGKTVGYVALFEAKELSKQQRVWSHFRFKDRLPGELYFQFPSNTEQTGVTSWNVTITKPKIEVGAVVTEYTERKNDLVDKASLKAAGIEITSDMVELYGNQVKVSGAKGGTPVAMFENGMLNSNLINADKIMARQLQTTGSNGQSVNIEDGLMRVYGTNGVCNIEFGVNSNGEAILSYYNKDGKWLYDLGPEKLDGWQLTESTLRGDKYVSALSLFKTNDFFALETYINVTVKQVYRKHSQRLFGNNLFFDEDQEIANNNAAHMGYKPFEKVSDVTTLYRYTAPRQSGTIISDRTYGLTTPALAKQADGKYFTSNSVLAINGQLTNLAPAGYYFRQSEQVMMAPYPMPSAGTQSVRFPAYSIRWLNITSDSTGIVASGFNAMMSYLMRTIKMEI